MVKVFGAIGLVLVLLSGCTMDPCTFEEGSPSCAVSHSKAQATISAIDSDRELRSTQSAIYLAGEGTKAAISADATRQVVRAEATREALQAAATRSAISAQSTQDAVVYASTQTFVDGEATKQAVQVGGVIDRANAERAAMPYNAVFSVLLFWFIIPGLVVAAFLFYGQRIMKRLTEALTAAAMKRAATVRYGQANDPKIGFITFDPKTGQPQKFITAEGLIGNFADLLTGGTVLELLEVPPEMKLKALVEAATRTQAAHISASTGKPPWDGAQLTREFYEETQPALAPVGSAYQVSVVSHTMDQMSIWLDEVDRRLLEESHD